MNEHAEISTERHQISSLLDMSTSVDPEQAFKLQREITGLAKQSGSSQLTVRALEQERPKPDKEEQDQALPDHLQPEPDHLQPEPDLQPGHSQPKPIHSQKEPSHSQKEPGHSQPEPDHSQPEPDHSQPKPNHSQANKSGEQEETEIASVHNEIDAADHESDFLLEAKLFTDGHYLGAEQIDTRDKQTTGENKQNTMANTITDKRVKVEESSYIELQQLASILDVEIKTGPGGDLSPEKASLNRPHSQSKEQTLSVTDSDLDDVTSEVLTEKELSNSDPVSSLPDGDGHPIGNISSSENNGTCTETWDAISELESRTSSGDSEREEDKITRASGLPLDPEPASIDQTTGIQDFPLSTSCKKQNSHEMRSANKSVAADYPAATSDSLTSKLGKAKSKALLRSTAGQQRDSSLRTRGIVKRQGSAILHNLEAAGTGETKTKAAPAESKSKTAKQWPKSRRSLRVKTRGRSRLGRREKPVSRKRPGDPLPVTQPTKQARDKDAVRNWSQWKATDNGGQDYWWRQGVGMAERRSREAEVQALLQGGELSDVHVFSARRPRQFCSYQEWVSSGSPGVRPCPRLKRREEGAERQDQRLAEDGTRLPQVACDRLRKKYSDRNSQKRQRCLGRTHMWRTLQACPVVGECLTCWQQTSKPCAATLYKLCQFLANCLLVLGDFLLGTSAVDWLDKFFASFLAFICQCFCSFASSEASEAMLLVAAWFWQCPLLGRPLVKAVSRGDRALGRVLSLLDSGYVAVGLDARACRQDAPRQASTDVVVGPCIKLGARAIFFPLWAYVYIMAGFINLINTCLVSLRDKTLAHVKSRKRPDTDIALAELGRGWYQNMRSQSHDDLLPAPPGSVDPISLWFRKAEREYEIARVRAEHKLRPGQRESGPKESSPDNSGDRASSDDFDHLGPAEEENQPHQEEANALPKPRSDNLKVQQYGKTPSATQCFKSRPSNLEPDDANMGGRAYVCLLDPTAVRSPLAERKVELLNKATGKKITVATKHPTLAAELPRSEADCFAKTAIGDVEAVPDLDTRLAAGFNRRAASFKSIRKAVRSDGRPSLEARFKYKLTSTPQIPEDDDLVRRKISTESTNMRRAIATRTIEEDAFAGTNPDLEINDLTISIRHDRREVKVIPRQEPPTKRENSVSKDVLRALSKSLEEPARSKFCNYGRGLSKSMEESVPPRRSQELRTRSVLDTTGGSKASVSFLLDDSDLSSSDLDMPAGHHSESAPQARYCDEEASVNATVGTQRNSRAGRKITPVKRRLRGAGRKGTAPGPFRLHVPPTSSTPACRFEELSVGQQFLSLLSMVPVISEVIREPRTEILAAQTSVADGEGRRELDYGYLPRPGKVHKRKLCEVYADSEDDPDFVPDEASQLTDSLEYTEGEDAGVSAEEEDAIALLNRRTVTAEVHVPGTQQEQGQGQWRHGDLLRPRDWAGAGPRYSQPQREQHDHHQQTSDSPPTSDRQNQQAPQRNSSSIHPYPLPRGASTRRGGPPRPERQDGPSSHHRPRSDSDKENSWLAALQAAGTSPGRAVQQGGKWRPPTPGRPRHPKRSSPPGTTRHSPTSGRRLQSPRDFNTAYIEADTRDDNVEIVDMMGIESSGDDEATDVANDVDRSSDSDIDD